MNRLAASLFLGASSTPAWAAGGLDDVPLFISVPVAAVFGFLILLPTVGLGFFLQGFFGFISTIGTSAVLISALIIGITAVATRGGEKVFVVIRILPFVFFFLSPFIAMGWLIGKRDEQRQKRRAQSTP